MEQPPAVLTLRDSGGRKCCQPEAIANTVTDDVRRDISPATRPRRRETLACPRLDSRPGAGRVGNLIPAEQLTGPLAVLSCLDSYPIHQRL